MSNNKFTVLVSGIRNNKTNTFFNKKNYKNKSGEYSKRFINYINELKPSQLNKLVKKNNIKIKDIFNLIPLNNRNFIYNDSNNKFYNKKWLVSRVDLDKKIFLGNTIKDLPLNQGSYEIELRNDLIKLDNETINKLDIDLKKIKIKKLIELINENVINTNKLITLNLGDNYYTLSNNFLARLDNIDINKAIKTKTSGSDVEFYFNNNIFDKATIELVEKDGNVKPNGQFFKYYNITHFDLSKYGIFKKEDINKKTYNENCLYTALKNFGLDNNKLTKFKSFVNNRSVPICKLNDVCINLNISIKLNRLTDIKKKVSNYGNNKNIIIEIALIEEHYFLDDLTNITSFCIKNYNEVKNIKDCNKIEKYKNKELKTYNKSNNKFIKSYDLVKLMIENKNECLKLIPVNDLQETQYNSNISYFDNLNYTDKDIKIVEKTNNIEKYNDYYKIYFDFETWADKEDKNLHKPYCVCFITEDNIKKSFYGLNCSKSMLNYISTFKKDKIMLLAHNAKYDYLFLSKYFFCEKPILKDGNFYSSEARYYYNSKEYYNIIVKDTYKLISMPLSKFGKCFNLDVSKEIMPYNLYNEINPIKNKIRNLDDCLTYLNEKDYNNFINNCILFKCITKENNFINNIEEIIESNYDNYNIDIIKYSKCYCEIDCDVLKKGYETFKKWMMEITQLNIDNILTIASLSHKYLINQNVYEGCYLLSGIPRAFIQKCIVGGRVMCNSNKKNKELNKKIADYDACSLYPSAMDRLGDIGGYLKGKPKILKLNQLNMNFLNKQDGYYIKIKINKVNNKYNFPLLSKLNNEGIRNFTNELKNEYIYIDKISLEDAINIQKIEFNIIQGYYFNEGRNNNIKQVINYLYNERKIKKTMKNPIQECYKLIMNSAYGKTILKPSNTKTEIIYVKNFNKFISYNYNKCKEIKKIDENKYLVESYQPLNNQFNMVHIGCEILSMSKRIMNEVMCLAEDNNIDLYYQDTDSIHLNYNDVKKLESLYMKKYNKILNGKEMGQFHIDFDLKGADSEIYSKNSIFLGKKCYIDELECINKDGKKINGYHIRMKGVNNESILYECNNLNITPLDLFKKLYDGEKIKFDLTCGGDKCCFEFNKMSYVSTKTDFIREIVF